MSSRSGVSNGNNDGEALISNERLGCDSPVMWPDQNFFGDFNPLHLSPAPPKWLSEINKDDSRMINEFGSLTQAQLMDKVRGLQNMAYQLGVEEAKEMSRGKCLDVFQLPPPLTKNTAANTSKRTTTPTAEFIVHSS